MRRRHHGRGRGGALEPSRATHVEHRAERRRDRARHSTHLAAQHLAAPLGHQFEAGVVAHS
eukprot:3892508-Prymnesium_polylepis.1